MFALILSVCRSARPMAASGGESSCDAQTRVASAPRRDALRIVRRGHLVFGVVAGLMTAGAVTLITEGAATSNGRCSSRRRSRSSCSAPS